MFINGFDGIQNLICVEIESKSYYYIQMGNNNLRRFEATVFQSVLEKILLHNKGQSIDIRSGKFI